MPRTSLPIQPHVHGNTTKWTIDRIKEVYKLALLGCTDENIAEFMEVNINTINLWKRSHPEFLQAMTDGKEKADAEMAHALYKRGTGFWMDEIHVCMYRGVVIQTTVPKYYPPESWAANKWLSVRQRVRWADVQRTETINTNLSITKLDFSGMTLEQLRFMKEIGMAQRQKAIEEAYVGNN